MSIIQEIQNGRRVTMVMNHHARGEFFGTFRYAGMLQYQMTTQEQRLCGLIAAENRSIRGRAQQQQQQQQPRPQNVL